METPTRDGASSQKSIYSGYTTIPMESEMGLHGQPTSMVSINRELYEILGEQSAGFTSSGQWKIILKQLEQRYRETFNGRLLCDDIYQLIAVVKLRIGFCLADEGKFVEAVDYYKQVWIQIGAFYPSSNEKDREFILALGQAAGYVGSKLIPMAGTCVIDDAIVGLEAVGIANAAFELTEPKAYGA
jgi:hypothetical protein